MRILSAGLGLLMACWAGCSSTETSPSTPTDAGTGEDARTGVDAGLDAADDAGASDRTGAIFAISDTTAADGGPKQSFRAGAHFEKVTSPDQTTTSKTVGPCLVEIIGSGDEAVEEVRSAGKLRLEGGLRAVEVTPKADGTYAAVSGAEALWSGGETLTLRADGKDVPAFTTTLTAPGPVTLSAPTAPAGLLAVTRAQGVNATFTGTGSGTVVLYFGIAGTTKAYAATCSFPVSAGTAVIPASVFADFPAGTGSFNFYVKSASSASPDGWDIRFTVSKGLVDTGGNLLFGDATFN